MKMLIGLLMVMPTFVLAATPEIRVMRCPEGGVQPQAMVDSRGRVHLIYLKGEEGKSDVFYVCSGDGGKSWSKAIRVNSVAGAAIATGTVRGAQLAIGKGDRVHVAWMGSSVAEPKGPGGATPMLYARMNDAGDGFEAQRNVITKAAGLDGGGSVAADPNSNRVAVAWHAPMPGTRGEENRTVFYAYSTDGGRTFEPEQNAIYPKTGACGCCGMRAVFTRAELYFLYRDVAAEERSMRLAGMITAWDAGAPGRTLEGWETKTCPMSTAALITSGDRVLGAWETAGQVQYQVVAGPESDKSEPIEAPGKANGRKHPSLAVAKTGEVLLAWDEGTGWKRGGTVHWQVYDRAMKPLAGAAGMARGLPVWSLTSAVAMGEGFLIIY